MAQSKSFKSVFTYQSWVHAAAGATGGVIAMSIFYPLDTVRFRLQLEDPERRKAQNTFKVLIQLVKEEGFSTLYRGLIPALESLCISNFVYFYTFHSLKAINGQKNQSALRDLVLGIIAGVVNVFTTTPFWVVNSRLKMKGISGQSVRSYNSLLTGIVYITKMEGFKSLWSGTLASLLLVINPALQFMMYEAIKRRLNNLYGDLPGLWYFAIGALAKAFSTFLTYPIQLVQTKQRNGCSDKNMNISGNSGMMRILFQILRLQGIKGLYRGLEAKLLQTVLTAALMFSAYEKIVKYVTKILITQTRVVN